jgi:HlyD family secretion protein
MRRRTLIIIVVIALLAVGAYLGYTQVYAPSVAPTPTPEAVDDFETVIWASGEVIPATWANLSFRISGRVSEMAVSEGDKVEAGTVLARLDAAELEDAVAAAEAAVVAAEADLARLEAGPRPAEITQAEEAVRSAEAARDAAQAQLDQAQAELKRLTNGARPAEIAQAEEAVRSAEAARGTAQAQVDQAQAELNRLLAGAREEEVEAAAATVMKAEAALRLAQAEYDKIAWASDVGSTPQALALETATLDYEAARANYEEILNGARPEEIEAAQAVVAAARSGLAQAKAGVSSAQAALDLVREGASAEEIAAAQAAVARAEANLAQAEAGVGSARAASDLVLEGATPEQIAIAEASVAQAEANLTAAQTALDQAILVAPFDGTVSEIYVREGEQVISGFPDEPVMTLGDLSTMRVETTDLRETDVGRIAVGQEVDITFDALPDTLLKGKVVYISPKASSEQGGVNYTTIIEFDELDPRLRWGMTAYVNITVD